jgi:hypothetical protein
MVNAGLRAAQNGKRCLKEFPSALACLVCLSFNTGLGKSELQFQVGGNRSIKENCTFDFGVIGGEFASSPRVGVQLGFSIDF